MPRPWRLPILPRLFGRLTESRTTYRDPYAHMWGDLTVRAASGERVNEATAMGITTYFACIRNIAEDVSKTVLHLIQESADGNKEPADNHPAARIIREQPNAWQGWINLCEAWVSHAVGWKGGFIEIQRNQAGQPVNLYLLDPTTITVKQDGGGVYFEQRRLDGQPVARLSNEDVLHLHGLGYDGITGYVLAHLCKQSVGNALAMAKFTGAFFGNGSVTSGVIEYPEQLSDDAYKRLRESWAEQHSGAENQWRPLILEEGAKWSPISVDPEKAQLGESQYNVIEDICAMFRMPLHKVMRSKRAQGWSTLEAQERDYHTDCLSGWFARIEDELTRKLIYRRNRTIDGGNERTKLYWRFNAKSWLRADTTAQTEHYVKMLSNGVYSVNDVRRLEDLNPIEGGDQHLVPLNLTPIDKIGEEPTSQEPSVPPQPDEDGEDENPEGEGERSLNSAALTRCELEALKHALVPVLRSQERLERDKVKKLETDAERRDWVNDTEERMRARIEPAIRSLTMLIAMQRKRPAPDSAIDALISRILEQRKHYVVLTDWPRVQDQVEDIHAAIMAALEVDHARTADTN